MASPICTVNGSATTNGVDVTASSVVTIALASTNGVRTWSLQCIGTDDTQSASTITSGLAINQTNKTATYTHPGAGTSLIFESKVNGGLDANGRVDSNLTTTFKVCCLTAGGARVLAQNETTENSATFGWTGLVNSVVRNSGSGSSTGTGHQTINVSSDANFSVTSGQWQKSTIRITDTGALLTRSRVVTCPAAAGETKFFDNQTAVALEIKAASGTGFFVYPGERIRGDFDGTNFYRDTRVFGPAKVFDCRDYGLVGGNVAVAEDHIPIQAAIDAAEAWIAANPSPVATGAEVYIPECLVGPFRWYLIGKPLVMRTDFVTLRGDGCTRTMLRASGFAGGPIVHYDVPRPGVSVNTSDGPVAGTGSFHCTAATFFDISKLQSIYDHFGDDGTPATACTIECWIKPTNAGQEMAFAACRSNKLISSDQGNATYTPIATDENSIMFGISNGFVSNGLFARVDTGGTPTIVYSATPNELTNGVWQHVAMSWDGSDLRIYADGSYRGKVACTGSLTIKWWEVFSILTARSRFPAMSILMQGVAGQLGPFRVTKNAVYTSETTYTIPTGPFVQDVNTVILNNWDTAPYKELIPFAVPQGTAYLPIQGDGAGVGDYLTDTGFIDIGISNGTGLRGIDGFVHASGYFGTFKGIEASGFSDCFIFASIQSTLQDVRIGSASRCGIITGLGGPNQYRNITITGGKICAFMRGASGLRDSFMSTPAADGYILWLDSYQGTLSGVGLSNEAGLQPNGVSAALVLTESVLPDLRNMQISWYKNDGAPEVVNGAGSTPIIIDGNTGDYGVRTGTWSACQVDMPYMAKPLIFEASASPGKQYFSALRVNPSGSSVSPTLVSSPSTGRYKFEMDDWVLGGREVEVQGDGAIERFHASVETTTAAVSKPVIVKLAASERVTITVEVFAQQNATTMARIRRVETWQRDGSGAPAKVFDAEAAVLSGTNAGAPPVGWTATLGGDGVDDVELSVTSGAAVTVNWNVVVTAVRVQG